jgi:molybdate transport system regulatory protein
MKVACKIWIDHDGKAFGDGPSDLLKGVEKTGSLHKGADRMGMAYSKAWTLIRLLERRLGVLLLDRKAGGRSGGGSQITPQARELVFHYDRFREEAKAAIEKIYQKHFSFLETTGLERADGALKDRQAKDAVRRPRAEMKERKSRMPQRRSR